MDTPRRKDRSEETKRRRRGGGTGGLYRNPRTKGSFFFSLFTMGGNKNEGERKDKREGREPEERSVEAETFLYRRFSFKRRLGRRGGGGHLPPTRGCRPVAVQGEVWDSTTTPRHRGHPGRLCPKRDDPISPTRAPRALPSRPRRLRIRLGNFCSPFKSGLASKSEGLPPGPLNAIRCVLHPCAPQAQPNRSFCREGDGGESEKWDRRDLRPRLPRRDPRAGREALRALL
mmetsp:Transcript_8428/g.16371  ORF Transcript_8428/g.16371 Transcript_8428/m.16371 type:complete len:230 (-) Transcript_8428:464-1153(-)